MPPSSDARLLVLHGLRLKGFAEAGVVADLVGLDPPDVEKQLDSMAADGLVLHREGRLTGWSLTPAGRTEQEHLLATEVDDAGVRDRVAAAYRRFLGLNGELLEVCTAWQMKGDALNDHTDAAYDNAVIARLGALHVEVTPVLDDLAATLARFSGYAARFQSALDRLGAGEREYFAKPIIDSYHTVWFELHEDLLGTLGIERAKEGAS